MKIESTIIPGLKLLYLDKYVDSRGSFLKVFNDHLFLEHGLSIKINESYFTVSKKNVIRGMHFQAPPFEHTKLVYLNMGMIEDVVLDIRKESPTFGKHFSIKLDEDSPVIINIPKGCAHGFLSLRNNSMITYLQSSVYNPKYDFGIKWDSFGMKWKIKNPEISSRDLSFPSFVEFNSPF